MKNYNLLFLFLVFLHFSFPSQAGGIPVYDASSYTQLLSQLDQMSKDYQKQVEQLEQAIRQADALTGTRNMGSLENSAAEEDLRRYLPNTWQDTLEIIHAGGLGASATDTQSIYNNLLNTYKPASGADIMSSDPEGPIAKAYNLKSQTTYAAMAAGEQSYNKAANQIDTYERLLDELNNTTDLKSSVDLQSRIAAENGMILNELVRLQSISINQSAADSNSALGSVTRAKISNTYNPEATAHIFTEEEEE